MTTQAPDDYPRRMVPPLSPEQTARKAVREMLPGTAQVHRAELISTHPAPATGEPRTATVLVAVTVQVVVPITDPPQLSRREARELEKARELAAANRDAWGAGR